jgi:hypothetical protein
LTEVQKALHMIYIYLGASPSWKISGWWCAALKPFREKKKLATMTIQHHMATVLTNVVPLYACITSKGMNGIRSSFLKVCLTLPLTVKYSLKHYRPFVR